MNKNIHWQKCCVVFPLKQSDVFYMNMRVYRVERADHMGLAPETGSRLIWCAVCQSSGDPRN